jgi:DNA polymerase-3 subunit alpha
MPHAPFVHLRVRSQFSLLEGAVRHDELAARCQALAMPAVAVTDRANLFGAMQFSEAMKRAGVQPILGTLLPLATEPPRARAAGGGSRTAPALVPLLVQNEAGYRNLLKLMSRAYLGDGEPVDGVEVGLDALCAHAEGLICLSGGATGPIGAALAQGDRPRAAASFAALHAAFGDRFYQEISRHGLEAESAVEDALLELAYAAGVPLVATNDVHFLDEDFYEAHDVLLCIASGAQVSQEERRRLTPEHRLKTPAEMAMLFADLPEAVANTLVIAQRCAFMAPARAPILPTFAVDEAAEMRREAAAGLERRLADTVWTAGMDAAAREAAAAPYRERLAFECDVIVAMNFPGYFLIVSDFIRWAKRQGIPVGPGRGSGAGSLVAWSLAAG